MHFKPFNIKTVPACAIKYYVSNNNVMQFANFNSDNDTIKEYYHFVCFNDKKLWSLKIL